MAVIETTAEQLKGHRIRIECPVNVLAGHRICVTDLETGEVIQNITQIELILDPREANCARLELAHSKHGMNDVEWEHAVVEASEVALTAYIGSVE